MKQISCLLIDDDTDDRDFFRLAIKELDKKIEFHYASTGSEALEKLKSGELSPNYIFLDLNMMPMNGLECLLEIKKISKVVDIPVIIYSTSINEDIKYKTLEAGAFDHFEKPATVHHLVNYLERVLP
jgi:DNA-binding NtrC family response regulator